MLQKNVACYIFFGGSVMQELHIGFLLKSITDKLHARADAARWAEQASARLFARWVRAWSGAQRWENE